MIWRNPIAGCSPGSGIAPRGRADRMGPLRKRLNLLPILFEQPLSRDELAGSEVVATHRHTSGGTL